MTTFSPADAGSVDLDADVIALRILFRGEPQRFAVAEADFQHPRRAAPECGVEIAGIPSVIEAETRPQLVERALLRRGEAPLPQHEAAYGAVSGLHRERLALGRARRAGHPPTRPSSGEEALA